MGHLFVETVVVVLQNYMIVKMMWTFVLEL